MMITLVLVIASLVSLTYLIYRYARYSPWRSQPIGRAFMMMKAALWACLAYVVAARLIPLDWGGRRVIMVVLLLFLLSAILTQIAVIVRLQGGFRRGTHVEARDHVGV